MVLAPRAKPPSAVLSLAGGIADERVDAQRGVEEAAGGVDESRVAHRGVIVASGVAEASAEEPSAVLSPPVVLLKSA